MNDLPLDTIICGGNTEILRDFPPDSVDLMVTSPPYGEIRLYSGEAWSLEGVSYGMARALKPGGVIVWVVGDQTKDGSESGDSFRQALQFMGMGLRLHDTMIYHRQAGNPSSTRYWQNFEYMFVFSKGRPKTINLIRDRKNKFKRMGQDRVRQEDGSFKVTDRKVTYQEYGYRENIWYYPVGGGHMGDKICHKHPAPFPEALARDHIITWSNPGDIVLDPFAGSFTTCKVAKELDRRYIGIDISEEYCKIGRERLGIE